MERLYKSIANISYELNEKNWAEGNAGNISINISEYKGIDMKHTTFIEFPMKEFQYLQDTLFLISNRGSRMSDIHTNPKQYFSIIRIDKNLNGYYMINSSNNAKPTSEIYTHFILHNYSMKNNRSEKVIIHTHPTEIIALSHIAQYKDSKKMSDLLNSMHSEMNMVFPNGIGFVKYLQPGSIALAKATLECAKKYPLCIWEKHGVISINDTLEKAFDSIAIINKCASIYFLINK